MSDVIEKYPRLPYAVMEFALSMKGTPTGAEMDAACRQAWDRVVASRPVPPAISFNEVRQGFEATLHRNTALRSRPEAKGKRMKDEGGRMKLAPNGPRFAAA